MYGCKLTSHLQHAITSTLNSPLTHPTPTERTMASRGKQGAQSKYDHLIKLLLIGDSGT